MEQVNVQISDGSQVNWGGGRSRGLQGDVQVGGLGEAVARREAVFFFFFYFLYSIIYLFILI